MYMLVLCCVSHLGLLQWAVCLGQSSSSCGGDPLLQLFVRLRHAAAITEVVKAKKELLINVDGELGLSEQSGPQRTAAAASLSAGSLQTRAS